MQFQFSILSKTESELKIMPEFVFDSPFRVELLFVVLCAWLDKREKYVDTIKE